MRLRASINTVLLPWKRGAPSHREGPSDVGHRDVERCWFARPRHLIDRFPRIVGVGALTPLAPAALFTSTKRGISVPRSTEEGRGSRPNLSAPRLTRLGSSRWPATRDGTLDYRGGPLLTENSSEIDVDLDITKPERVTPTPVLLVLPVRVPLAEAVVGRQCSMSLPGPGFSAFA